MYIQSSEGLGQPVPPACKPDPGERAASLKPAGILTKDVEITDKGVLVTDFGIDQGSVKGGAKSELTPLIHQLETDPTIDKIEIRGFTDCIGTGGARYHKRLRSERARRVYDLLGPVARAKVRFVGSAPLDTFNGPNTDRAGRARNRSVLIELHRTIAIDPERPITGRPCKKQLIDKAIELTRPNKQLFDAEQGKRLGFALLRLGWRDKDDRVLHSVTVYNYVRGLGKLDWLHVSNFFDELCEVQAKRGKPLSEMGFVEQLKKLDELIIGGLRQINLELSEVIHSRDTMLGPRAKAVKHIAKLVEDLITNDKSTYYPYRNVSP